jgi:hypothetical protein
VAGRIGGECLRSKALFSLSLPYLLVVAAALLGVPQKGLAQACQERPSANFHPFTIGAGSGIAYVAGTDGKNIYGATTFQVGGGLALTASPVLKMEGGCFVSMRRWSVFLNANFLYDRSGVNWGAVEKAILANPLNTALLSATAAQAKFFTATLDPTIRYAVNDHVSVYGLAGFGWFRRTIEFTGTSSQGVLLQPNSPGVFGQGGNSGVVDGGGGADFGLSRHGGGLRLYLEGRFVQGLAVNSGTRLFPLSAGLRW